MKVRANVDSRYYAGVYPYVTGVIRGTDGPNAEEVLSLGHLYEQGAHDNATGVASIIGAAETLNRLIKAGRLPRPKRTIRVLGMGECYGTNVLPGAQPGSRQADDRRDVHRFARRACSTWLAPNTPGFSIRIRRRLTSMRWRCGWRRSTTRRWAGRGDRSEHRSSTDNYLGDPVDRHSDGDAARRLRRAGASQQRTTRPRRSIRSRCAI